jgi:hypothetical protein
VSFLWDEATSPEKRTGKSREKIGCQGQEDIFFAERLAGWEKGCIFAASIQEIGYPVSCRVGVRPYRPCSKLKRPSSGMAFLIPTHNVS